MTADPPGRSARCCGEGGAWARAGKPLVLGCQLCPNSPTYWQRPENRGDGKPYTPVKQLGSDEQDTTR